MVTITSTSVDVMAVSAKAPEVVDATATPKGDPDVQPGDDGDFEDASIRVEDATLSETPKGTKYASYAAKKTVAQGMMDIALITSNANQLRYLLEYGQKTATFYFAVTFIVVSLLLQIAVGVSLIFKGKLDLKGEAKMAHANRINNYVVVGVFMVTIINVFVAAFSVPADAARTTTTAVASTSGSSGGGGMQ